MHDVTENNICNVNERTLAIFHNKCLLRKIVKVFLYRMVAKGISVLQQKKTFIYKMKQIQVKNYGNTAKMVVIKIGMRIAIYFCKRIDD